MASNGEDDELVQAAHRHAEGIGKKCRQRTLLLDPALDHEAGRDQEAQSGEQGEDHRRPAGIVADEMLRAAAQQAGEMIDRLAR